MQRNEIKEILLRRLATLSFREDVIINSHSYRRADLIQHVKKKILSVRKCLREKLGF